MIGKIQVILRDGRDSPEIYLLDPLKMDKIYK